MSKNKDKSKVRTNKQKLQDTLNKYDLTTITEPQFIDLYNQTITQNGICGVIHTRISAGNYWYVLEVEMKNNLKSEMCKNLIESGKVKEFDVIRHNYTNSKEQNDNMVQQNNICPTLDTRCDCLGVVVNDEPSVVGGIGEKKSNGGTQWYQQDRVYDDNVAISVTTSFNPYYVESEREGENPMEKELRIRKLTPRECFRLQGLKDEDIDLVMEHQSDGSGYHLAGDSICVNCLLGIFSTLCDVDWTQKFNPKEWWK